MGNDKPLLLGGGQIRVAGRYVGQIINAYVEKAVQKVPHQTNFGLEYKTDHVLAISTAYNLGFTMQYINPANANLLCSQPGFSAVPDDRSLPGERRDISLAAYGLNVRQYTENPRLTYDEDNKGVWSPLIYPICSALPDALKAPIINISNQDYLGVPASYQAYCVLIQNAADATTQSLPSNVDFVPFNTGTPGHEALLLMLKQPEGQAYIATDEIQIYMADVVRDPITGEFDFSGGTGMELLEGTAVGTDTGWDNVAIGAAYTPGVWRINGDNTAGGDFFGVDLYGDTAKGGTPQALPASSIPITIFEYDYDSIPSNPTRNYFTWLVDFMYETNKYGGGAVKLTKGSTITHGTVVDATYNYDTSRIRELPLTGMGRNPVVPVTLEILFPDNLSKMIWHFYKTQINTNFRFAVNETDWMGVDFMGETLDASDVYPQFGFGYLQFAGPIIDLITQFGNHPFGTTLEMGDNQTQFA